LNKRDWIRRQLRKQLKSLNQRHRKSNQLMRMELKTKRICQLEKRERVKVSNQVRLKVKVRRRERRVREQLQHPKLSNQRSQQSQILDLFNSSQNHTQ
jgi:hypothetical protein